MMEVRSTKPLQESLRDLLAQRGMSQAELWAAADLSPAVVSRYLSGERGRVLNGRSMVTLEKLAAALGVEPEFFLEYRQTRVVQLAAEAVADGLMEPEDFEAFLRQQRELRRLGA